MIGFSKKSAKNYSRECFSTEEEVTWIKILPGIRAKSAFEQLGPENLSRLLLGLSNDQG